VRGSGVALAVVIGLALGTTRAEAHGGGGAPRPMAGAWDLCEGGVGGVWRVKLGDDPAYADPDLDDRDWSRVHLDARHGGSSTVADPGGVVWFRREVATSSSGTDRFVVGPDLAVLIGAAPIAYEVWVEGFRVATVGHVGEDRGPAHVNVHALPPDALADGWTLVALRTWHAGAQRDVGRRLGPGPWSIGLADAVGARAHGWIAVLDRTQDALLAGALGLVAFAALALLERGRRTPGLLPATLRRGLGAVALAAVALAMEDAGEIGTMRLGGLAPVLFALAIAAAAHPDRARPVTTGAAALVAVTFGVLIGPSPEGKLAIAAVAGAAALTTERRGAGLALLFGAALGLVWDSPLPLDVALVVAVLL
jgi:hypothetical protein